MKSLLEIVEILIESPPTLASRPFDVCMNMIKNHQTGVALRPEYNQLSPQDKKIIDILIDNNRLF
jgi:hypothetical protein